MEATLERTDPGTESRPTEPAGAGRALAWVLSVAVGTLAVWALASSISSGAGGGELVRDSLIVVWSICGFVLTARRPSEALGFLVLAGTALAAAGSLFESIRPVALALAPAVGLHLLIGMPTGLLRTRARRGIVTTGYAAAFVLAVALWSRRPNFPAWPVAVEVGVILVVGLAAFVVLYGGIGAGGQRRMKWLVWAMLVAAGIGLASLALHALVSWPGDVGEVATAATVLIPLGLVAGTSRRSAGVIDPLLVHTISAGGLVLLIAAVYLVVVLGLGRVPRQNERTLLVLSMVAAAVATILYFPAHSRLTRLANRVVYRERRAPDEAIRTFGSRLSRSVPLDELLMQLAESLRKAFALSSAEVWTLSGDALHLSVSDPERARDAIPLAAAETDTLARAGVSGPAWAKVWLPGLLAARPDSVLRLAPIVHSGELLGMIVVERTPDAMVFSDKDDRTLTELARQVGLVLHNVRLDSALQASLDEVRRQARELQASRGRIVAAADAARRRIERDLHDGAQQHLVALAVKVRLAKQFAEKDPARANTILSELGTDLEDTLHELRDLAHGIYPPLLADKGLPEALASAARRAVIQAEVRAAGIGRYPSEVEAAVYFCCLEAMQNAAKHAGEGARAEVAIKEEAGGLVFEVTDDGAGFDVRARAMSAGFTNMNDRLGAVGGSLRIESSPGRGTRVSGAIPLGD